MKTNKQLIIRKSQISASVILALSFMSMQPLAYANNTTGLTIGNSSIAIGDNSITTSNNGSSIGVGAISTGNNISRAEFNNQYQDYLNKQNQKTELTNKLSDLNNQLSTIEDKKRGFLNDLEKIDAKLYKNQADRNKRQELQNQIDKISNDYSIDKTKYSEFVSYYKVLSSLDWSQYQNNTVGLNNMRQQLKTETAKFSPVIANKISDAEYDSYLLGYVNVETTLSNTLEQMKNKINVPVGKVSRNKNNVSFNDYIYDNGRYEYKDFIKNNRLDNKYIEYITNQNKDSITTGDLSLLETRYTLNNANNANFKDYIGLTSRYSTRYNDGGKSRFDLDMNSENFENVKRYFEINNYSDYVNTGESSLEYYPNYFLKDSVKMVLPLVKNNQTNTKEYFNPYSFISSFATNSNPLLSEDSDNYIKYKNNINKLIDTYNRIDTSVDNNNSMVDVAATKEKLKPFYNEWIKAKNLIGLYEEMQQLPSGADKQQKQAEYLSQLNDYRSQSNIDRMKKLFTDSEFNINNPNHIQYTDAYKNELLNGVTGYLNLLKSKENELVGYDRNAKYIKEIEDASNKIAELIKQMPPEPPVDTATEQEKAVIRDKINSAEQELTAKNTEITKVTNDINNIGNITLPVSGENSFARGTNAFSSGDDSIAIGTDTQVTGNISSAIGKNNIVAADKSNVYGLNNSIEKNNNDIVLLGNNNTVNSSYIDDNGEKISKASSFSSITGNNNTITSYKTHIVGNDNNIKSDNSLILGNNNNMKGSNNIHIGNLNSSVGMNNVLLGNDINITDNQLENSVVLGNGSTAETHGPIQSFNYRIYSSATNFEEKQTAGLNPIGVVSVGKANAPRTIINVSSGDVTETSLDAVNGSQLYGTHKMINNLSDEINYLKNNMPNANGYDDILNITASGLSSASFTQEYNGKVYNIHTELNNKTERMKIEADTDDSGNLRYNFTGADVKGDSNITASYDEDNNVHNLALSKNLTADSLTVNNGGPVINQDGVNMSDKIINNMNSGIDGTKYTDAADNNAASVGDVKKLVNNGTKTKVKAGQNTTVTYDANDDSYTVSSTASATGTKTKLNGGKNITVTEEADGSYTINGVDVATQNVDIEAGKNIVVNKDNNGKYTISAKDTDLRAKGKYVEIKHDDINGGYDISVNTAKVQAGRNVSVEHDDATNTYTIHAQMPELNKELVGGKNITISKDSVTGKTVISSDVVTSKVNAGDNIRVTHDANSNTYTVTSSSVAGKQNGGVDVNYDAVKNQYSVGLNKETMQKVENGQSAYNTVTTKGLTFKTDNGSTTANKLGSEIKITGDNKNIVTKTLPDNSISIELKRDINVGSVTVDGGAKIDKDGMTMANKQIKDVSSGIDGVTYSNRDDNNAANIGDVKRLYNNANSIATDMVREQVVQQLSPQVERLEKRVDYLDKEMGQGLAAANALSGLAQPIRPGASMISAGVGGYRNYQAIAVGASKISDNGNMIFKFGASTNLNGKPRLNYNASFGYMF